MKYKSVYEPAWQKLKANGHITLVISKGLHKRIYKAVTKRKNKDSLWLFQCAEQQVYYAISYELSDNGLILTIKLTPKWLNLPPKVPKPIGRPKKIITLADI